MRKFIFQSRRDNHIEREKRKNFVKDVRMRVRKVTETERERLRK